MKLYDLHYALLSNGIADVMEVFYWLALGILLRIESQRERRAPAESATLLLLLVKLSIEVIKSATFR